MKIVLPGGSGQVGQLLLRALGNMGHSCVVLSRRPARIVKNSAVRVVAWDGCNPGPWVDEINGADVVINLAGRSVNCRYNEANLHEMLESRVQSTRTIGAAIATCSRPPRVWLQAATATVYAHRFDASNDEATGIIGGSEPGVPAVWARSVQIGQAWEAELANASTPHTRKIALRSSLIMSPDPDGVFSVFASLCSLGMGRQGDGRQYVSWIHEHDFAAAIEWLIQHEEINGVVNFCAPHPLPNREFIAVLHRALGRPLSIPAPAWALELGAAIYRTDTELLLKSRRVVPGRLLQSGFRFAFPEWPEAARELCARWRAQKNV